MLVHIVQWITILYPVTLPPGSEIMWMRSVSSQNQAIGCKERGVGIKLLWLHRTVDSATDLYNAPSRIYFYLIASPWWLAWWIRIAYIMFATVKFPWLTVVAENLGQIYLSWTNNSWFVIATQLVFQWNKPLSRIPVNNRCRTNMTIHLHFYKLYHHVNWHWSNCNPVQLNYIQTMSVQHKPLRHKDQSQIYNPACFNVGLFPLLHRPCCINGNLSWVISGLQLSSTPIRFTAVSHLFYNLYNITTMKNTLCNYNRTLYNVLLQAVCCQPKSQHWQED